MELAQLQTAKLFNHNHAQDKKSPYAIMQSAVNDFEEGFIMEREPQGNQQRDLLLKN